MHKRHPDIYDLLLSIHKYFDFKNNSKSHEIIIEIFLYTYRFRKAGTDLIDIPNNIYLFHAFCYAISTILRVVVYTNP